MLYVGVDIGGTGVKAGIVDGSGKILQKSSIETKATRHYGEVLFDIAEQVKKLVGNREVAGVGIGCPGAIDSANGIIEYSNNLYWKNVPLAETLKSALNMSVKVSNDANVAALGEAKFGAGKEYSDTIMLTLGTGVGGGIVIGNKLFEGYKSMGAELGHTVLRSGGVPCTCGRRGCVEAYASATALIRDTVFAMFTDKNSKMWEYVGGDLNKVDGRTSFECAKAGDKTALEVVENYISYLSEAITDFVNVFRCQAVILGGGVSAQGEYLLKPLQKLVDDKRYGGKESLAVKILAAKLGNDAGIIGAAALLM